MLTYVCGRNSVREMIEQNVPLEALYVVLPLPFQVPSTIKVVSVSKEELSRLTQCANHQGIAAVFKKFDFYPLEKLVSDKPPLVIVVDHVQDPHNLGAIIRTANAAGVKHIVLPQDRGATISPTVFKVASGGMVNMAVVRVNSLQATLVKLQKLGYWIYASTLSAKAVNYAEVKLNTPAVLIVGNEASGVSPTLVKMADVQMSIPMNGTVQSLNVSVATGHLTFFVTKIAIERNA